MITLSEFINRLKLIEATGMGHLPVALCDWSEGYEQPILTEADKISIGKALLWHGPMPPWGRRGEGDFEEVDAILIGEK